MPVWDQWSDEQTPPLGLVHGDYRLDNLLFERDACRVVDWQTVTWGPPMLDLSYFIGNSLRVEDRRAHEHELVRLYHDELARHGEGILSWEQCWEGYRREAFAGIGMVVVATMMVEHTERGDEMFMTSLARTAQQIIDLDALSLLPEPSSATGCAAAPRARRRGAPPGGARAAVERVVVLRRRQRRRVAGPLRATRASARTRASASTPPRSAAPGARR